MTYFLGKTVGRMHYQVACRRPHIPYLKCRPAKTILLIVLMVTVELTSLPVEALAQELTSINQDGLTPTATPSVTLDPIATLDPKVQAEVSSTPGADLKPAPTFEADKEQISAQSRQSISLRSLQKSVYKGTEPVTIVVDNAESDNLTPKLVYGKTQIDVSYREIVTGNSRVFSLNPPSVLKPGAYTVVVEDDNGEQVTQDFSWGVLALNTNKSIYAPGEDADVAIAVLDAKGEMACDAGVALTITEPDGRQTTLSTENKRIVVNNDCHIKDVTEHPDFEAMYHTGVSGTYQMSLTAAVRGETYAISDAFSVEDNAPFDVERLTATRIYPINPYDVKIKITARQDFDGEVSDIVPESFQTMQHPSSHAVIEDVEAASTVDDRSEVARAAIGKLRMPFSGKHPITLGFGEQITDPSQKKTYEEFHLAGHDGIDFDMPMGTPVLAVDDGTVTLAKDADYGLTMVIQHSWGKSYYGHLRKTLFEPGSIVTKGQQIALSGNSGTSDGPHLHFGIKPLESDGNNGYYGKINPLPFLPLETTDKQDYSVHFLKWHVTLQKGESTTLWYTYDAPDKSPEFYTLGPLSMHNIVEGTSENGNRTTTSLVFQEARPWQIAVDATVHMLLFWDPANGAAPAGWSVVSTYDGRYIRGEGVANALATGGNATHTPTLSGSVTVNAASAGGNGGSTNTASSFGHTHTASVTIGAANNLPVFRSMQLIQFDTGIPTTIPQNAIAMYDASPGMPVTGWTRITAQDSHMLRVNSTVATGGSDTHTHTLTWGSLTTSSGTVSTAGRTNNAAAATSHTHTAPAATATDSQTSLPPYIATVFASANSSVAVPDGLVGLFDGDPGGQYLKLSESGGTYYQKFIRGDTQANAGTTGGSLTHSHGSATSGPSGAASATTKGGTGSGTVEATAGHTHTLSASFATNDDHTPQYVNFVVARKVNIPVLNQNHFRWRNDDGSETTATWRRSEDVPGTKNINTSVRLRIEISNDGALTSGSETYRLEYGQKSTTCDAISTWTAVPTTATTEHFQMDNSANLTDGSATTNVVGGLTDGNTTFVAGQQKDTSNTTAGITLANTEFTEIEYSILVTTNATAGNNYCFRLTNAGSTTNFQYTNYAEITAGDPNFNLEHYRWRNDDSGEADLAGQTLYYNPTGNGFAQNFTIAAGCSAGSEWDCVDDGSSDTSATAPTNDGATSALTLANGVSYYTLADDAIQSGSTITRLDVFAYATDTGNPDTNIQIGYCTVCDGSSNVLGGSQAVHNVTNSQFSSAFTGLSLTTTDLNNMQLVVSADGTRATITTVYVLVTYTKAGASWKSAEDTAYTSQAQNSNIRLRVSLANTGDIAANRNFRLEYAKKAGATCGDDESFTTLPVTASTEVFETTTSSNFSDGDATTAQLTSTGLGTFAAGKMIQDPSNSSGTYSMTNGNYSEFEYNFQANSSAVGTYCFRVTDSGTVLDSYSVYPELTIPVPPGLLMRHGKYFAGGAEQPFTF